MAYRELSKDAARELLVSILSEEQWNRFNHTGILEIAAKAGTYRISMHDPTRVLDSEGRYVVATMRLNLPESLSARDRAIAEYLLIRNDENMYWQTATLVPEKGD